MARIVREGSEELTGGMVTSQPPHLVGVNETIGGQNLDPRSLRGAVTRNGRSQHGSNFSSDLAIDGLRSWTRDNGTAYLVGRFATTFYDFATGVAASIGIGGTQGQIMRAAALNDSLVVVVDGLAPQVFTGSTLSALGGSPPSEARYAVVHSSKLWLAGDDANPQKKTFSATNNPADFTSANDAGSITSQDGGGDTIQGLATNRQVLLTCYRNFTDVLVGNSVANFAEQRLLERGLVSKTGIVSGDGVAFFASDDAVYMVAGTRFSDLTTLKLRSSYYDDISDKSKITLLIKGDLLIVVDYGSDNAYACAYKYNRWHKWTTQPWKTGDLANDQTLYAGADGASTTQIWKLDTGSIDGAATINAKWRTPNLGFGWPDSIKSLRQYGVHAKPGLGTVTVTFYKNGTATGNTKELTFASSGDHDWDMKRGETNWRGHYLSLEFSWTGPGTMYGWVIYGEIATEDGKLPVLET